MTPIKLSIIIPALNEEKLLPVLLESIEKQDFKNYEIIVADAQSKDKTKQIAENYGCQIVAGGTPPVSRNNAAKSARGEYLLFLDSDVKLPKMFLKKLIGKVEKKGIEICSCWFNPLSRRCDDFLIHHFFNCYNYSTQFFYPHAPGYCIFAKKEIHEKISGFNENLLMGEDHDYVKRAAKFGKFKSLFTPQIFVSVRRYDSDGRLNVFLKYTCYEFYRWINGDKKTKIFKYEFNHHKQNDNKKSK